MDKTISLLTSQLPIRVQIGFLQDGYGSGIPANQSRTRPDGVATSTWTYPANGIAHTIVPKVKGGQALAIAPVTLTVGVKTELWLWIRRGSTSMDHTVYVRLVRANSTVPIPNVTVRLDVNDEAYTLTTNSTGYGEKALKLEAVGGQATTYRLMAMFNGTNPQTRNLTVTAPNGQDYAVCTTIQFGFKPSMNTATLMVEAPKTDVTVEDVKILPGGIRRWMQMEYEAEAERSTVTVSPPKTPQQTQQEAQNRGWLNAWNEFTWSWPFYRIHFNVTVASFSLHAAFNPVLPGGEEMQWKGIESFSQLSADAVGEVRLDLFGLFAQYVIARLVSSVNPAIAIITEAVKFAVQATDLYRDWNDKTALLASSIINFLMAVIAIKIDLAGKFLLAICNFLVDAASSILRVVFETFLSVVAKAMVIAKPLGGWLDIIEAGGDIALGAIGLARWGGVL